MNAYATMRKLIENLNRRFDEGRCNQQEYTQTAATYSKRLDVFFGVGRITDEQYSELMSSFKTF